VLFCRLLRCVLPERPKSTGADCQDFRDAFTKGGCDCHSNLAGSGFQVGRADERPLQMYLADIYTVTGSLAESRGYRCLAAKFAESCRGLANLWRSVWGRASAAIGTGVRGSWRRHAVTPRLPIKMSKFLLEMSCLRSARFSRSCPLRKKGFCAPLMPFPPTFGILRPGRAVGLPPR